MRISLDDSVDDKLNEKQINKIVNAHTERIRIQNIRPTFIRRRQIVY